MLDNVALIMKEYIMFEREIEKIKIDLLQSPDYNLVDILSEIVEKSEAFLCADDFIHFLNDLNFKFD